MRPQQKLMARGNSTSHLKRDKRSSGSEEFSDLFKLFLKLFFFPNDRIQEHSEAGSEQRKGERFNNQSS